MGDLKQILLIGCGRMGGALLAGWLRAGVDPASVTICARARPNFVGGRGPAWIGALDDAVPEAARSARIAVLALKPQTILSAQAPLARWLAHVPVVTSLAAGLRAQRYDRIVGDGAHLVRAMPNLPAAIGEGTTLLHAAAQVPPEARRATEALFRRVGETCWLPDEDALDAGTAATGSGPGILFELLESYRVAAIAQGLPAAPARDLILRTLLGSAKLALSDDRSFRELRDQVASPGGTTAAALDAMRTTDGTIDARLDAALARATRRCREIGALEPVP